LDRLTRIGDLFKPLLTEKQQLPGADLTESPPRTRKSEESEETVVGGIRLPTVDTEVMKSVHWLKPKLTVEVELVEWTSGRKLRHARFRRLL
jgi:ATP-dependent DNA ligase